MKGLTMILQVDLAIPTRHLVGIILKNLAPRVTDTLITPLGVYRREVVPIIITSTTVSTLLTRRW